MPSLFNSVNLCNDKFPVATATPDFAPVADAIWPLKTDDVIPGKSLTDNWRVLISQQPLAFQFTNSLAEPFELIQRPAIVCFTGIVKIRRIKEKEGFRTVVAFDQSIPG